MAINGGEEYDLTGVDLSAKTDDGEYDLTGIDLGEAESKKKTVSQPIIEPVNEFSKDIIPSGATSASAAPFSSAKTPFDQFRETIKTSIKGEKPKEVSAMGFEIKPKEKEWTETFSGTIDTVPQAQDFGTVVEKAKEEKGSRLGYWYNGLLEGIGSKSAGAADLIFQLGAKVFPRPEGVSEEDAVKTLREELTPTIRKGTKQLLGAEVSPEKEEQFNNEFLTSAIKGLTTSSVAMTDPYASGLFLQAYDSGLQSINNTEKGKDLPEITKTIFAGTVGAAQGALEKYGLNKIFGKGSTKLANDLAAKTLAEMIEKGEKNITREMFEAALDAQVKTLKSKVLKVGSASVTEFQTGALQELSTILAEKGVNAVTEEQIFEPTSWGEYTGRIAYAGGQELVGGFVLGTAGQLMPSSPRNYISEKVSNAKSDEDIANLKQEIIGNFQSGKISEQQANEAVGLVDKYVAINSTIPAEVTNRKEVADLIAEKEEVQQAAEAKLAEAEKVDEAFKPTIQKEAELLQQRVEEINKEIINPKPKSDAKENQIGLPSEVGERQEPVKAEPIEEGRGTEVAPSGVLEKQEEKVGKKLIPEGETFIDVPKEDIVQAEDYFEKPVDEKLTSDMSIEQRIEMVDKNKDNIKDEEVKISDIIPTQNILDKRAIDKRKTDKEPVLIKWKGEYYVLDGHHRIVSDINGGKKSVKAKVIDFSEDVAGSKSDAMQQENTGNNAAPAQKLEPVPSLSDKAKQKFKDAGFKVSNGSLSETDFGVSSYFYIERPDGTQQKVRVSDHSVESKDRMDNEVFINMDSQDIDGAIREAKERINNYTKNKEIRDKFLDEEAEKNKGRAAKASAKWEAIKRDFEGQKFAVNERTYQSLEEFKKKVPDAKNIIQTPLDKGAFKYEYSVDKKSEIKGNEKPSQEYIENYEKETTTQDTQIESNQQQPSKGKAKGAVRATEKPVPVTDKEAKKQAREAKKQQEEELKKRKKDLANAEPNDIKQLILQYFYGGGRILTEDFKNETGFGTRGGQQDKVRAFKEFKKRIWAHSGKSPSMDDLVMQFQDEWKANYGSAEDQQAIRNEIIGVLKDFDSKSQIERELERLFSVGGKIVTSRDERNQSQQEEDLMQRYAPESAEEAAQMEAWEAMNRSQQDFVMEDDYTAYLLGRVDEMTEEEAQEYLDNEEKYNQLIKQENENYERESKTNAKDSSATTGQAKAAKEYEAELAELNKKLKDAEKAKRDKLDRISGKVDLFADEAKANELFGAEQNLSAENIAKQLKPETDKIAKLEAEKAAFEANKENYLKKYDNQSEISEAAPEKVLTEKEKAAKELADRIRKKKWGGANVVFDFGLTKTIYNFAVDKVADAVESGTELGKAIQQAVEWIESQMNGKEWDKKGFSDSFSDEGNDGKVPPTEKEGEPESAEGKTKKHILGLRVENSELIPEEIRKGLLEKGIEYIQKGVKVSQKEAQQIVDAYEKQGDLDGLADYVMNPLNRIEGDVKVALEQELYKKYAEKAGKATSEEEKAEYRKRTIDILYAAQKTGAEAGRAVNMQKAWQDIAGRDPQGIVAAYKREIEERNEPFLAKHEPSIKSAFEQLQDLLETEEGQQLIKEQIEKEVEAQVEAITEPLTTERRKKADKAIAAIKGFRNKIKANSYSDAVGIVAAVDTALGIIEKAIDKGASVADAIERGVRYVNKKMNGKGWNEAQFRKDVEQGFKDAGIEITEKEKKVSKIKDAATRLKGKSKDLDALIKDPAKALEELENKKVSAEKRAKERESKSEEVKALEVEIKLKKKLVRLIQNFDALTDKQKKDIISETLDFIVKNGYLSEAEFRNIFAKSIGLDHLTAQDEARILELSEIISKVKDAADKLSENPTPENVENFKKAFWEARKANEKLSGYFREKKSFLEFWSTAIRGSLLTPATGVLSFATNLVQTPIMLSEYATSTALDYIRYNLSKIDLLNKKFPNLFDKKQLISAGAFYSNYLPSMWSGLKEGAKQMWTGSMPESISDREMKGSLHPSDNFMKVWNSLSGKEKQSFIDNLQDSAEFLLGVPAETMFRILNLTDKPFRRGIEGGVLSELIELDLAEKKKQIEAKPVKLEADLAMLDEINSGREKTRLLTNPPEELMAKAEQEGLEGVFQDKHMITKLLEAASQRFKSEMKSRKGEKNRFQTYLKGLASVFKTTQFPYINMPANFLSLIIKYSNPVIPAMSAMFKLNKGDVRGAQKEMAAVVTSLIIGKVAEFLIVNGLATGAGDDDDEKKRSIKREGQPANTFNLSAFSRLKAGGNPNYQAGDYCVRYNQLGVAGVVVNTYANVYEMKGKKAFEQLDWTEKYINLTFSGGRTGLDQSMVSGTSALIDAFSSTNEYKFNRWATQTVKAIMSPIIPNTATKVIAATDRDNLLKNTREDDLVTWVKNNMKAQLGLDNDLPNFITIWGEKAKKTPTDRNAWVYQLFDFTKGAPTNQDYVASEIYKLWKSQYDIDKEYGTNLANAVIPETSPKIIKINEEDYKLTKKEYEELSILIGKKRKDYVNQLINDNIDGYEYTPLTQEEKIAALNDVYEIGKQEGIEEFIYNKENSVK